MKLKNVIVWILLLGIIVLLMSTSVQAKELTEVNATDILEKIENGEDIYLENVHIVGELDLSEIELKTIPNTRTGIEWEIKFRGLEEELKIVESKIEINDSVFEDDVDFSNTQFRKDIDFSGTSFLGEIDFTGADFNLDAYFRTVDFSDAAHFQNANFSGDVSFHIVDFSDVADFYDANFSGDVFFTIVDFSDVAYFGNAHFRGNALYLNVDFSDGAIFRDAKFSDNALFFFTEFNEVDFEKATFTKLSLIDLDFNQMRVEWSSLKDVLDFNGPTYIKLIKNFREMEQFEDADAAYYQYRRLSQANKEWSYSKLMDVVAGASCGYGVKPERPLIWAFVLIMVFTLVYWLGDGITRLKENAGDKNRVSRWAAFYNAFYFSVVTFTTVGYGDWYPEDRYRIVVMIEGVLGWLLLALFIVTLANVMIRP